MVATVTFPGITPDRESRRLYEPRTLTAPFGDGYEQRSADGINPYKEEWLLSFRDYDETDMQTIIDFLDSVGSHDPFFWTPPLETALTPNPKQWRLKDKYEYSHPGYSTISLTFSIVRVFDL